MADIILSPNMNLPVPIVGQDPGPDWANNINACLGILDQHNHIAGSGNLVPVAGLDINADFPLNGNNLVTVKTVNFQAQGAPLPGLPPNLGAIYVAGNELYYNDEAGNVVAITNSGSVNAGAGSITGLPSGTASASYSSGTFIWQSATSTPANMDFGSAIIRNIVANSKGLTLSPPSALAADYSITFPLLPTSTQFVTIDTSGNMGTQTSNQIGQAMTSVGANAIYNTRTIAVGTPASAGNLALSASSGSFTTTSASFTLITNFSVTITTSGRPVEVRFVPEESAVSQISQSGAITTLSISFQILRDAGVQNWNFEIQEFASAGFFERQSPTLVYLVDTTVNGVPGTYTYEAFVKCNSSNQVDISNIKLMAREM